MPHANHAYSQREIELFASGMYYACLTDSNVEWYEFTTFQNAPQQTRDEILRVSTEILRNLGYMPLEATKVIPNTDLFIIGCKYFFSGYFVTYYKELTFDVHPKFNISDIEIVGARHKCRFIDSGPELIWTFLQTLSIKLPYIRLNMSAMIGTIYLTSLEPYRGLNTRIEYVKKLPLLTDG